MTECNDTTNNLPVAEVVEEEGEPEPYPPWNFAWIVEGQFATMAWPQNTLNLDYLHDVGIRQLITLSPEKMPPVDGYNKLGWTLLPIDEFEDPSVDQIGTFIELCQSALRNKQPVGVHCRMGHGRSGVMAACYLIRFKDMTPESAIAEVRLTRANAVETTEQERVIFQYYNRFKGIPNGNKSDDVIHLKEQPPAPAPVVVDDNDAPTKQ